MKKVFIIVAIVIATLISGIIIISNMSKEKNPKNETVTVGLILNGEIMDKSWGQSHYEGLMKTADALDLNIIYRENVPEDISSMNVVDELVENGSKIILANSFGFGELIEKSAEKYPDVYFYHATGVKESKNVATYFGRIYQMRYLSGVVAGLQTKTNEIGYVAAFPISEVNRGINAFTLGVRSVNPDAKVYVSWCNSWTGNEESRKSAEKLINNHNIDVMTLHSDSVAMFELCEEKGIWSIGYNIDNSALYPKTFLTAAVWDWEKFYTPQIRACIQKKFLGKHFWEGIESGMITLSPLTANVKSGTADIIKEKTELLSSGTFDIFYGPIKDNKGVLRIDDGESMSDFSMLNEFDWYVEGVVIDE